jgi:hypothetical protein
MSETSQAAGRRKASALGAMLQLVSTAVIAGRRFDADAVDPSSARRRRRIANSDTAAAGESTMRASSCTAPTTSHQQTDSGSGAFPAHIGCAGTCMRAAMARQIGADRSAIAQQDARPAVASATKVAGGNTAFNGVARTEASSQQLLTRAAETAAQPSPASAPARPAPPSDPPKVPSATSAAELDRRRAPPRIIPSPCTLVEGRATGQSQWDVAGGGRVGPRHRGRRSGAAPTKGAGCHLRCMASCSALRPPGPRQAGNRISWCHTLWLHCL